MSTGRTGSKKATGAKPTEAPKRQTRPSATVADDAVKVDDSLSAMPQAEPKVKDISGADKPQEELPKLPKQVMAIYEANRQKKNQLAVKSHQLIARGAQIKQMQLDYENDLEKHEAETLSNEKDIAMQNNEIARNCGGDIEIVSEEGHYRLVEKR